MGLSCHEGRQRVGSVRARHATCRGRAKMGREAHATSVAQDGPRQASPLVRLSSPTGRTIPRTGSPDAAAISSRHGRVKTRAGPCAGPGRGGAGGRAGSTAISRGGGVRHREGCAGAGGQGHGHLGVQWANASGMHKAGRQAAAGAAAARGQSSKCMGTRRAGHDAGGTIAAHLAGEVILELGVPPQNR